MFLNGLLYVASKYRVRSFDGLRFYITTDSKYQGQWIEIVYAKPYHLFGRLLSFKFNQLKQMILLCKILRFNKYGRYEITSCYENFILLR